MDALTEMAEPRKVSLRRRSPVRFWFGVGATAVALIVTLYLGAMTLVWGLHVKSLRADRDELVLLDAERAATLADQEEELTDLHATLMQELRGVTEGANDKALYGDLRYVYDDYALALKECADARADVVDVVRERYIYVTWTVHRYDNEVADYCNQLKGYWAEALAEEES